MTGIPALNPYGTYNAVYSRAASRTAGLTSSISPELQQLDVLFNNVKFMTSYARQAAGQRDAYRARINEFATAARGLAGSAGGLLNLSARADAPKTIAAVREAAGDFNNLGQTLQQADNLTAKGRRLLNSLQAAAAVREQDLNTIGIAYNRSSGELTVDEPKLKQAVATDYRNVKEVLGGSAGLAKALDQAVSPVAREPISEYFTAPAPQMVDYTRRQGRIGAAAYSRGLLIDLLG